MIKMYLTRPLHPAATPLEVIVTGPQSRGRATVPPHWVPGAPLSCGQSNGSLPGTPGDPSEPPPVTGPAE